MPSIERNQPSQALRGNSRMDTNTINSQRERLAELLGGLLARRWLAHQAEKQDSKMDVFTGIDTDKPNA